MQQEMQTSVYKTCLMISLPPLTLNTKQIQTNPMNSLLYAFLVVVPTIPGTRVVNCLNNTAAVTYILLFFHHSANRLKQA